MTVSGTCAVDNNPPQCGAIDLVLSLPPYTNPTPRHIHSKVPIPIGDALTAIARQCLHTLLIQIDQCSTQSSTTHEAVYVAAGASRASLQSVPGIRHAAFSAHSERAMLHVRKSSPFPRHPTSQGKVRRYTPSYAVIQVHCIPGRDGIDRWRRSLPHGLCAFEQ